MLRGCHSASAPGRAGSVWQSHRIQEQTVGAKGGGGGAPHRTINSHQTMGRAKKGTLVEHGMRALPSRVDPPEAKPAQVGALLATDAELDNLMADGVMAWLVDGTYERPHKQQRSGQTEVHKKKVHAASCCRIRYSSSANSESGWLARGKRSMSSATLRPTGG